MLCPCGMQVLAEVCGHMQDDIKAQVVKALLQATAQACGGTGPGVQGMSLLCA